MYITLLCSSSLNKLPYDHLSLLLSPLHSFLHHWPTNTSMKHMETYVGKLLGPYGVRIFHQCQYTPHLWGTDIKLCLPSWSVILVCTEQPTHCDPKPKEVLLCCTAMSRHPSISYLHENKKGLNCTVSIKISNPRNLGFFQKLQLSLKIQASAHWILWILIVR